MTTLVKYITGHEKPYLLYLASAGHMAVIPHSFRADFGAVG
ncbi:MAG: hypothetical protein ACFNT6_09430 [Neisseria sp.]|uniref:Uncharacterized protein n=1 Tax=Neisseria oralis TaxID=1107316 RepID=A0ABW8Q5M0_9NEIS